MHTSELATKERGANIIELAVVLVLAHEGTSGVWPVTEKLTISSRSTVCPGGTTRLRQLVVILARQSCGNGKKEHCAPTPDGSSGIDTPAVGPVMRRLAKTVPGVARVRGGAAVVQQ